MTIVFIKSVILIVMFILLIVQIYSMITVKQLRKEMGELKKDGDNVKYVIPAYMTAIDKISKSINIIALMILVLAIINNVVLR